ncbi:response regulator [Marinobacter oulmenensis]|uniref:CheY-like chemotaxis protein n=1 Tax=Marinobacter oulmenensis TaxID=643747 RepID=A0A840UED8_9GAMM|nr:response regulator [Marinobacter oulmenensis]MBB5321071.1 CheY-like chemotaxis protein [Marinobacter oulmenensis]
MTTNANNPLVLIAEDDPDDQLMLRDAFRERCGNCQLCFVNNGVELMDFLSGSPTQTIGHDPLPALLLLDLNMPFKDGRQSLTEIRANNRFRGMPTIILTTSRNDEDRQYCLSSGADGFLVKPARYTELLALVDSFQAYLNCCNPDCQEGSHD